MLNDTAAKGAHMYNFPSLFTYGMRMPDRLIHIGVANNVTIPLAMQW